MEHGSESRPKFGHESEAALHLDALTAREPDFIEFRMRSVRTGRWSRDFVAAGTASPVASAMMRRAATHDVYVGVLLRRYRRGRRQDLVLTGRVLWSDLDGAAAERQLAHFPIEPTALVASGTTGHRHAYWRLSQAVALDEIELLNRALARRLDGDPASADAARILRLAGTLNHKSDPPSAVHLLEAPGRHVEFAALRRALKLADTSRADGQAPSQTRAPRRRQSRATPNGNSSVARLEALAPGDYVAALTGEPVHEDSRKVRCPLHPDKTPSLHVYETAGQGWFCFGCGRGGTIYDLAAAMTSRPLRGPAFLELQRDLVTLLVERSVPAPGDRR